MTGPYLLGLMLRHSELQLQSNIIAQLVLHEQVLPPDVLIGVTIGKFVVRLIHNNSYTNFAQNLLNRL
jgi:hypothetical protein